MFCDRIQKSFHCIPPELLNLSSWKCQYKFNCYIFMMMLWIVKFFFSLKSTHTHTQLSLSTFGYLFIVWVLFLAIRGLVNVFNCCWMMGKRSSHSVYFDLDLAIFLSCQALMYVVFSLQLYCWQTFYWQTVSVRVQ